MFLSTCLSTDGCLKQSGTEFATARNLWRSCAISAESDRAKVLVAVERITGVFTMRQFPSPMLDGPLDTDLGNNTHGAGQP
jgi:hypothetical protein